MKKFFVTIFIGLMCCNMSAAKDYYCKLIYVNKSINIQFDIENKKILQNGKEAEILSIANDNLIWFFTDFVSDVYYKLNLASNKLYLHNDLFGLRRENRQYVLIPGHKSENTELFYQPFALCGDKNENFAKKIEEHLKNKNNQKKEKKVTKKYCKAKSKGKTYTHEVKKNCMAGYEEISFKEYQEINKKNTESKNNQKKEKKVTKKASLNNKKNAILNGFSTNTYCLPMGLGEIIGEALLYEPIIFDGDIMCDEPTKWRIDDLQKGDPLFDSELRKKLEQPVDERIATKVNFLNIDYDTYNKIVKILNSKEPNKAQKINEIYKYFYQNVYLFTKIKHYGTGKTYYKEYQKDDDITFQLYDQCKKDHPSSKDQCLLHSYSDKTWNTQQSGLYKKMRNPTIQRIDAWEKNVKFYLSKNNQKKEKKVTKKATLNALEPDLEGLFFLLEEANERGEEIDYDVASKQYGFKNFKDFVKIYASEYEIENLTVKQAKEFIKSTDTSIEIVESQENLDKLYSLILNNKHFKKKNTLL